VVPTTVVAATLAPATTLAATATVKLTTTVKAIATVPATTRAPATVAAVTTNAPIATTTVKAPLSEGTHTAFLVAIGPAPSLPGSTLVFDPIDFLTGDAAVKAADAKGLAEVDDNGVKYVANDYFIANDDTTTSTMRVTPDALVTIIPLDNADPNKPKVVSLTEAVKLGKTGNIAVHLPFNLTVQGTGADARIVKVEHIFTP
jgi:hypothetical protein